MVNPENLVIHNTFDAIEDAKAEQQAAPQRLVGPMKMWAMSSAPQNDQAGYDKDIGSGMKHSVPKGIEFEACDICNGVPAAEHMVPLQQLVQNNTIEEAAET